MESQGRNATRSEKETYISASQLLLLWPEHLKPPFSHALAILSIRTYTPLLLEYTKRPLCDRMPPHCLDNGRVSMSAIKLGSEEAISR
jgi:hypothetical protein